MNFWKSLVKATLEVFLSGGSKKSHLLSIFYLKLGLEENSMA
jgi:hypothetical protein